MYVDADNTWLIQTDRTWDWIGFFFCLKITYVFELLRFGCQREKKIILIILHTSKLCSSLSLFIPTYWLTNTRRYSWIVCVTLTKLICRKKESYKSFRHLNYYRITIEIYTLVWKKQIHLFTDVLTWLDYGVIFFLVLAKWEVKKLKLTKIHFMTNIFFINIDRIEICSDNQLNAWNPISFGLVFLFQMKCFLNVESYFTGYFHQNHWIRILKYLCISFWIYFRQKIKNFCYLSDFDPIWVPQWVDFKQKRRKT